MWLYGFTTFLSAFLVFQVQLLLGKFILPWYGGVPAVWTTCMLFFQTTLLLGYGYAHWLAVRPRLTLQRNIHIALVLVSLASIAAFALVWHWPLLPDHSWRPPGDTSPITHILVLLAAAIGIPFITLSATAPLLQRWFSLTQRGQSPYRLYALSNVGSLAGLLSYPFLVEVLVPLKLQAAMWTAAYALFAAGIVGVAVIAARTAPGNRVVPDEPGAPGTSGRGSRLSPAHVGLWFGLAACASALLLAVTNQLTQEIAVVPFLWMLPLVLYLLTFVLTFAGDRWYPRKLYLMLLVPAVVLVTLTMQRGIGGPIVPQIVLYGAALFVLCLVCHGELVRLRPDARHLTLFYLTISAGGAAGGVFVGVLAPLFFSGYWELSITLVAAVALIAVVLHRDSESPLHHSPPATAYLVLLASVLTGYYVYAELLGDTATSMFEWARHQPFVVIVTALAALMFYEIVWRRRAAYLHSRSGGAGVAGRAMRAWRQHGAAWRTGALVVAVVLFGLVHAGFILDTFGNALEVSRNFFGVLHVGPSIEPGNELALKLRHGRTLHGLQYLSRERRTEPTTYYTAPSGISQALRLHPRRVAGRPMRIGVVGLGAGTLAAYGRRGDRFRFYEIDPDVVRLAAGPEAVFTFVKRSPAETEIVLGDARISLEREPPQRFHLLAVDAFSSGSIPVHLLTREAIEVYLSHLDPRTGVLALHVTNRYLDLIPVVVASAKVLGLEMIAIRDDGTKSGWPNDWLLLARRTENLPRQAALPVVAPRAPWTDDYSNLLQAVRWRPRAETTAAETMNALEKDALLLDLGR